MLNKTKQQKISRGYKETKIGLIPDDWDCIPCKKICKLTAGGTPSTAHKEYWNGNIPWMSSGELNLKRVFDVNGRITEEGLKNSSTKLIPKHSVLVGLAGQGKTRGTVAINEVELCTNQSVAAIMPDKSRANYLYIFYSLENRYYELRRLSTGDGGRGGLNLGLLGSLKIACPPIQEQKKIADILGEWDSAIFETEKLISLKKNLKKALCQQLLTGKRRFKEFIKSKEFHETKLGFIPSDWRIIKFKEIFKRVTRKNDQGVDRVLTASGKHGLVDQLDYFHRSVSGDLIGYYLLRRGEYAYNRSLMNGYPFGAIKRLDNYENGSLSTLYLCFALKDKAAKSDFYKHLFEAGLLNRQLRMITQMGARAHGLLNVTTSDFFELDVPLPNIQEQNRIAAVLDCVEYEIALLDQKLELLKHQKRGLMQKLLTGKIRVKI